MAKRESTHLSIPVDLKNRARAQAILQGKDLSQVVRELLSLWLAGVVQLPKSGGAEHE